MRRFQNRTNTNGLSWVFLKLSALWWIKIRVLPKLTDGRDWMWFMDLTFQVRLPYKTTLILWPHIPSSYAILFFTALNFTSTTWCIHNWTLFLLWLSLFILSGAISLLFSISMLELWQWRRLLRVLWTSRRSNQSILKEISPEYSLAGLMLKLKLQYFGHLMWRTNSLEKTLTIGKIEGRRRRGRHRMKWLDSITDSMDMSFSKLQEMVKDREAWYAAFTGSQTVRHDWATELNWSL